MRINVLGPLEVVGDGTATPTRPKERAIVAYLALRAGRPASVADLVDALWGGESPLTAVKSLQSYVARARSALGRDVLVAAADGYRLTLAPDDIDVVRFERALESSRALRSEGRTHESIGMLDEAVGLWRGSPDVDLPESDTARAEAARLVELYATALEDRLETRLLTGDLEWAIAEGERLAANGPLRERRWSLLMTALYAAGRQADALRAFQRARSILVEELGIEPGEALRGIERRVVAQDPTLGAPEPERTATGTTAPSSFGRADDVSAATPPTLPTRLTELPSGTVTFVMTDIEGSTALWDRAPDDMSDALDRHDELITTAVLSAGGVLLKHKGEGDSTMSVFPSAAAAVAAAQRAQRMLADEVWPHRCPIRVRMAVSTGEVEVRDGDYYGPAVNRAARIRGLASGGQVLLGTTTHALVVDHLGADVELLSLGERTLRGMTRPEQVWELRRTPPPGGPVSADHSEPFDVPFPALLDGGSSAEFAGRAEALAGMVERWRDASGGARRTVLIAGEPGIGKTRLAAEVARAAHEDGAVVLYGRCDEHLAVPFQPFVEALDELAGTATGELRDRLGERPGELRRLSDRLGTVVAGLAEPVSADPDTERAALFDAVASWLDSVGGDRGVVLVVDDLQWAGVPTMLLLRHVVRTLPDARLLVIGTYRDTDVGRAHPSAELLAELRRESGSERLALGGLGADEVEVLVAGAAGHELDDEARGLAAVVHAETSGNPLFVGEVLKHLVESGAAQRVGGQWRLVDTLTADVLPQGLRDVIGRRLSHLSAEANELAAWASVIGRDFRLDILTAVAGRTEDEILDALDETLDARLVEETGPDRYRFGHAVVQAALYDELRTSRRIRMHRSVGEAFETIAPEDLTALSYHFGEAAPAGEYERAIRWTRASATRASETRALDEASRLRRRAVDLHDDSAVDGPEAAATRCDLLLELGLALRLAGGDWRSVATEAIEAARALGDGERLAHAAFVRNKGWATTAFAVNQPLVDLLEECIVLLPAADSATLARVLGLLALELHYSGDTERIRRVADAAVDMANRLGAEQSDPDLLFTVLIERHSAFEGWPDPAALRQRALDARLAASLADRLSDPLDRVRARHLNFHGCRWILGDVHDVEQDLPEIDDRQGRLAQWAALFSHAGVAMLRGDLERAEELADAALRVGAESGEDDAFATWGNQMLFLRRQQGRPDEAAALIGQVLATGVPDTGLGEWNTGLAFVLCEADRLEDARVPYGIAAESYRHHLPNTALLPSGVTLAACVADLGDHEVAAWLIEKLEPHAGLVGAWGPISLIGPVSLALGRLASCLGRFDDADGHFAHAGEWATAHGVPYSLAESQVYRAENLLRRADPDLDVASALLDDCTTIARRHGFGTLERRAGRTRAASGKNQGFP